MGARVCMMAVINLNRKGPNQMDALEIIARAKASRVARGLHVHWTLPDGSKWSALASSEEVKAKWIAGNAAKGWVYMPELDFTA